MQSKVSEHKDNSKMDKDKRNESSSNGHAFKCSICMKFCDSLHGLKEHVSKHIFNVPMYECKTCKQQFRAKPGFLAHSQKMHRKSTSGGGYWYTSSYVCTLCGRRFKTKQNCVQHIVLHDAMIYNCKKCHWTFDTAYQVHVHGKLWHKMAPAAVISSRCKKSHSLKGPHSENTTRDGLTSALLIKTEIQDNGLNSSNVVVRKEQNYALIPANSASHSEIQDGNEKVKDDISVVIKKKPTTILSNEIQRENENGLNNITVLVKKEQTDISTGLSIKSEIQGEKENGLNTLNVVVKKEPRDISMDAASRRQSGRKRSRKVCDDFEYSSEYYSATKQLKLKEEPKDNEIKPVPKLDSDSAACGQSCESVVECPICSRRLVVDADYHIRNHDRMKHKCPEESCGWMFETFLQFQHHCREVHSKRVSKSDYDGPSYLVKCPICTRRLATINAEYHMKNHGKMKYKCPVQSCGWMYDNFNHFQLHCRCDHDIRVIKSQYDPDSKEYKGTLQCPICKRNRVGKDHMKYHDQLRYKCPKANCGKKFADTEEEYKRFHSHCYHIHGMRISRAMFDAEIGPPVKFVNNGKSDGNQDRQQIEESCHENRDQSIGSISVLTDGGSIQDGTLVQQPSPKSPRSGTEQLNCSVCGRADVGVEHIEKHDQLQHQCPQKGCLWMFETYTGLYSHCLEKHKLLISESYNKSSTPSPAGTVCPICSRLLVVNADDHIKNHDEMKYKCPEESCGWMYEKFQLFQVHCRNVHGRKISKLDYGGASNLVTCPICSRLLVVNADDHIQNHNKMKYKCPEESCGWMYKKFNLFQIHCRKVHGQKVSKFDYDVSSTVCQPQKDGRRDDNFQVSFDVNQSNVCAQDNKLTGHYKHNLAGVADQPSNITVCPICGRHLTVTVDDHIKNHDRMKYKCPVESCGWMFEKSKNFRHHCRSVHCGHLPKSQPAPEMSKNTGNLGIPKPKKKSGNKTSPESPPFKIPDKKTSSKGWRSKIVDRHKKTFETCPLCKRPDVGFDHIWNHRHLPFRCPVVGCGWMYESHTTLYTHCFAEHNLPIGAQTENNLPIGAQTENFPSGAQIENNLPIGVQTENGDVRDFTSDVDESAATAAKIKEEPIGLVDGYGDAPMTERTEKSHTLLASTETKDLRVVKIKEEPIGDLYEHTSLLGHYTVDLNGGTEVDNHNNNVGYDTEPAAVKVKVEPNDLQYGYIVPEEIKAQSSNLLGSSHTDSSFLVSHTGKVSLDDAAAAEIKNQRKNIPKFHTEHNSLALHNETNKDPAEINNQRDIIGYNTAITIVNIESLKDAQNKRKGILEYQTDNSLVPDNETNEDTTEINDERDIVRDGPAITIVNVESLKGAKNQRKDIPEYATDNSFVPDNEKNEDTTEIDGERDIIGDNTAITIVNIGSLKGNNNILFDNETKYTPAEINNKGHRIGNDTGITILNIGSLMKEKDGISSDEEQLIEVEIDEEPNEVVNGDDLSQTMQNGITERAYNKTKSETARLQFKCPKVDCGWMCPSVDELRKHFLGSHST